MACRKTESFDWTTDKNDIQRKWTNVVNMASFGSLNNTNPRTGVNAISGNGGVLTFSQTFDDQASWVIGFGYRTDVIHPTQGQNLVHFIDNVTVQSILHLKSNGTLAVKRGLSTDLAGGTSTESISINTWYYIEIKITIANSIGADSCEVYLNGNLIITVDTAEDTQSSANASADVIKFVGSNAGTTGLIDDIYIFDGTGAENNDVIGDTKVTILYPNDNGATSDFVGSDADSTDNYLHVDDTNPDDDSTYTESSTVGHHDLYTFDDLPEAPDTIFATSVCNHVTKDDVGARTIRSMTRPISTNYFGTSRAPSAASYSIFEEVYDLNPETSAAWTEATLNATEFGIEIET